MNELVPVTFEDLRVGQPVAATYMGPVAESYPAQGIAGSIGILESSDDGSGDEDDLLCLIPEGCGPDGYILQVPAENSPGSSTPRFLTEGL